MVKMLPRSGDAEHVNDFETTFANEQTVAQSINMNKQQLIAVSLVADLLDVIVVGQIPGLSWFIDIPVICMIVAKTGPKGLVTVLELIPVVGTLPLFTIASFVLKSEE